MKSRLTLTVVAILGTSHLLLGTDYSQVTQTGTDPDNGAEIRGNLRIEDPAVTDTANEGLMVDYWTNGGTTREVIFSTDATDVWWIWLSGTSPGGVYSPGSGTTLMTLFDTGVLKPQGIALSPLPVGSTDLNYSDVDSSSISLSGGIDGLLGEAYSGSIALDTGQAADNRTWAHTASIAAGKNVRASSSSLSVGSDNIAVTDSAAIGNYNTARRGSFATGFGTHAGIGTNFAAGEHTSALAGYANAAFGSYTQATGNYNFAAGQQTIAGGVASAAFGYYTDVHAYYGFAVGQYNAHLQKDGVTVPSYYALSDDDPIFEVGVGTSDTERANAITVYRDGTVDIPGFAPQNLTVGAITTSGDITATSGTVSSSALSTTDNATIGGDIVLDYTDPGGFSRLSITGNETIGSMSAANFNNAFIYLHDPTSGNQQLGIDPNQILADINGPFYIMNSHANGSFMVYTGGVQSPALYVSEQQKVGIGTGSPSEKLHVAGSAKVDTDLSVTGASTFSGDATFVGEVDIARIPSKGDILMGAFQ